MKTPLHGIAKRFFKYLGRHIPQQCASDEFYFLPRSERAIQVLDRLDPLSGEKVQDHTRYVRGLLNELPREEMADLEQEIDRRFLKQGMESFLREYEDAEVWRRDPTLYVKIPLFAIESCLSQEDTPPKGMKDHLFSILNQIPGFLSLALQNLHSPSEISIRVASNMARDAVHFHRRDISAFIQKRHEGEVALLEKNQEAIEAWGGYRRGLVQLPSGGAFAVGEDALGKIIHLSLSCHKSPREILEMAQEAFGETQEKIRATSRSISRRHGKGNIKDDKLPTASTPEAFLALYRREVQNLRRFFTSRDILSFPAEEKIMVLQTPYYLQSLRATASYRAPLTGGRQGHGVFYVTPGKEDLELIAGHCPYLSAHETYPGHHILDHLRLNHPNPVRRQMESPLFYEGWACYGEQLLDELGYTNNPQQHLIQLKRQLWRSLRAILDVKIQSGKMTLDDAALEIEKLGFSSKRAQHQVRRFCLTPGYQLCYFLGTYEIFRLRNEFSGPLGLKGFHDALLNGGQIPFHLVKKRLTFCADRK